MRLVIVRQNKGEPDLKFAIELPDKLGEVYKEDFLRNHFIFYLEMALADLDYPTHIPVLVGMNMGFLLKKAEVVHVLDNKDE